MHLRIDFALDINENIEQAKSQILNRLATEHLTGLLNKYDFYANILSQPQTRLHANFYVLTADDVRDILDLIQDYEKRQKVKRILLKEIEPLRMAELW